jgi:hypothetical protein
MGRGCRPKQYFQRPTSKSPWSWFKRWAGRRRTTGQSLQCNCHLGAKKERFNSVVIASDSEYVVKCCERLALWEERDWKTAKGTDIINKDLWVTLERGIRSSTMRGVEVLFWRIPREWNEFEKQAAVSIPRC